MLLISIKGWARSYKWVLSDRKFINLYFLVSLDVFRIHQVHVRFVPLEQLYCISSAVSIRAAFVTGFATGRCIPAQIKYNLLISELYKWCNPVDVNIGGLIWTNLCSLELPRPPVSLPDLNAANNNSHYITAGLGLGLLSGLMNRAAWGRGVQRSPRWLFMAHGLHTYLPRFRYSQREIVSISCVGKLKWSKLFFFNSRWFHFLTTGRLHYHQVEGILLWQPMLQPCWMW